TAAATGAAASPVVPLPVPSARGSAGPDVNWLSGLSARQEPEGAASIASLGTAPDATPPGPFPTTAAEYRFTPPVHPTTLPGRTTEIWAVLHRPTTLSSNHPVLVFLHGNHGTCGRGTAPRIDDRTDYTTSGTCPAGYVVTPNHRGYDYVASQLASHGYVVVSI